MSRQLSSAAIAAMNGAETDEVFLILLTLDHDNLSVPIRVTSDAVDTISRGETYIAFPFELSLPSDSEDQSPRALLQIDNVDRQVVQAIRSITDAPYIKMEIVRAADPDTIEASFPDFRLTNIQYDVLTLQGELRVEDFVAEPYPASIFSPAEFLSLF